MIIKVSNECVEQRSFFFAGQGINSVFSALFAPPASISVVNFLINSNYINEIPIDVFSHSVLNVYLIFYGTSTLNQSFFGK